MQGRNRVSCCGKRIHSLAVSLGQPKGRQPAEAGMVPFNNLHTHTQAYTPAHTHTVSFRRGLCNVHGQNCSKQIFINAQIEQITVFLYAHTLAHTRGRHTHTCSLAY